MGFMGGLNLCGFVDNWAIAAVDPTGLSPKLKYKADFVKAEVERQWSQCVCELSVVCSADGESDVTDCASAEWQEFEDPEFVWQTKMIHEILLVEYEPPDYLWIWDVLDLLAMYYGKPFLNPKSFIEDSQPPTIELDGAEWLSTSETTHFALKTKPFLGSCTCENCGELDYVSKWTGETKYEAGAYVDIVE